MDTDALLSKLPGELARTEPRFPSEPDDPFLDVDSRLPGFGLRTSGARNEDCRTAFFVGGDPTLQTSLTMGAYLGYRTEFHLLPDDGEYPPEPLFLDG